MAKRAFVAAALVSALAATDASAGHRRAGAVAAAVPEVTFESVQGMNFGPIVAGQTAEMTSDIVLSGTDGSTCTITLDGGLYHSAAGRVMKNGKGQQSLPYFLYSDPNRSIPWGDGGRTTGGDGVIYTAIGKSLPVTVYGRLRTFLSTTEGQYGDMVTITINY